MAKQPMRRRAQVQVRRRNRRNHRGRLVHAVGRARRALPQSTRGAISTRIHHVTSGCTEAPAGHGLHARRSQTSFIACCIRAGAARYRGLSTAHRASGPTRKRKGGLAPPFSLTTTTTGKPIRSKPESADQQCRRRCRYGVHDDATHRCSWPKPNHAEPRRPRSPLPASRRTGWRCRCSD